MLSFGEGFAAVLEPCWAKKTGKMRFRDGGGIFTGSTLIAEKRQRELCLLKLFWADRHRELHQAEEFNL